jgi:hypothetical protein
VDAVRRRWSGDIAAARRLAGALMADNPTASLREIASAAGLSLATASEVRARLRRGTTPAFRRRGTGRDRPRAGVVAHPRNADLVRRLRTDPSLRFTEDGRALLRVLDMCALDQDQWDRIAAAVPPHHRATIAHLARDCAGRWHRFADALATQPAPPMAVG